MMMRRGRRLSLETYAWASKATKMRTQRAAEKTNMAMSLQGVNSIEYQQTFEQSCLQYFVVVTTLLIGPLKSLLRFN